MERTGWPFELLLSTAPQQGAICLAFALAMLALGHPLVALSALCFAALNLSTARELLSKPTPPLSERTFRLVWANVWGRPAAFARVMELAAREKADFVAIGELPDLSAARRREIAASYPFEAGALSDDTVALFARTPLPGSASIENTLPPRRSLVVALADVRLILIHPLVPYTRTMNANRDAMLAAAFALANAGAPAIIVGDCNTTSWSPALRALMQRTGAQRAALGWRSTWTTDFPVFGLPIDHAFAFGGARISARIGPRIGSDHFPLIVDVALDSAR